jgi:hypothetical protein
MAETRGDKYALPLSLLTQDQLHHHLASLTGVGSSEFYTKTASILNEKQPRIVIANSGLKKLHRRRLRHQTQAFPLAVITLGMIIRIPYYK